MGVQICFWSSVKLFMGCFNGFLLVLQLYVAVLGCFGLFWLFFWLFTTYFVTVCDCSVNHKAVYGFLCFICLKLFCLCFKAACFAAVCGCIKSSYVCFGAVFVCIELLRLFCDWWLSVAV
jgi:hypothetical protein